MANKPTSIAAKTGLALALALCLFLGMPCCVWAKSYRGISFNYHLAGWQKKAMIKDLKHLYYWPIKNPSKKINRLLGVSQLRGQSAYFWLRQRVHFIMKDLPEDKLGDKIFVYKKPWIYPLAQNSKVIGEIDLDNLSQVADTDNDGEHVVSNIGVSIYEMGKQNHSLMAITWRDNLLKKRIIPLYGPRMGVIQVGDGLFDNKNLLDKKDINKKANSLLRLGKLFHEARHSDGHGRSLGFFHGACPYGPYQNLPICDLNLNGPYSIAALVMHELSKSCDECSLNQKEQIRLEILEDLTRVVKKVKVADDASLKCGTKLKRKRGQACEWDSQPEWSYIPKSKKN